MTVETQLGVQQEDVIQAESGRAQPAHVTAVEARQTVSCFVITEISTQLRGDTPVWTLGERPCWSVPVVLTSPARGVVGQVDVVRVDATTGELLVDAETVQRIATDARCLAERSPL